jgi:membrane protease YdiL (CAAX protease family)
VDVLYLNEIKQKINELGNFPFIFILFIIAVFFWINGPAFFEFWDLSGNASLIQTYFVMFIVLVLWSKQRSETRSHLKVPLKEAIPSFMVGVLITFLLMNLLFLFEFISTPSPVMELFWPVVIIQFCVIANVEELIFRGVFLEYTGIIVSSVLFAIWHSFAYGFVWYSLGWDYNWGAMIFAFSLGMILGLIVEHGKDIEKKHKIPIGFPMAVAIHATYNLCILGYFCVT